MKNTYRINYCNPINYIWTILIIPVALIITPFLEETFQDAMLELYETWNGKKIYSPKKIFLNLKMVSKL